jgi:hypothetical protein
MARPKSENPRTEQLGLRFTPAEFDTINAVAFSAGQSTPEWVRRVVLSAVEIACTDDPRLETVIEVRMAARAMNVPTQPPEGS